MLNSLLLLSSQIEQLGEDRWLRPQEREEHGVPVAGKRVKRWGRGSVANPLSLLLSGEQPLCRWVATLPWKGEYIAVLLNPRQ